MRQLADHCRRSIVTGREARRELGAGVGLDLGDQMTEHVVEELDVVLVEARGAVDEKAGDALERVGALFARAVLQDVFQLGDEGSSREHQKKSLEISDFWQPKVQFRGGI